MEDHHTNGSQIHGLQVSDPLADNLNGNGVAEPTSVAEPELTVLPLYSLPKSSKSLAIPPKTEF